MKIKVSDSGPKLNTRRIQKFEKDTGIKLPKDYRDFMLKHNGGSPVDARFEIPDLREDAQLDFLYAIDGEGYVNIEKRQAQWKSEMPKGFLLIGHDPGGAFIIMGTTGKYAGRMYFWDHQHRSLQSSHERNAYLIAKSFSELLRGLKPNDGPSRWDADIPELSELIQQTLAHAGGIAPIQMARLATEFAKIPNPTAVVKEILQKLMDHESSDVRRVAVRACGRIEAFDAPGLRAALIQKLADKTAWVRFDAVHVIREAKYDGPDVRKALTKLARGVKLPQDEKKADNETSNADLRTKVEARKTLDALLAKPKKTGNAN